MVIICWIICWIIKPWSSSGAIRLAASFSMAPIRCVDSSTASFTICTGSELSLLRPPGGQQCTGQFISTFPLGASGLNWSEDRMMMGTIGRPPSSWTTAESLRNKLTLVHSITFKLLIFLQLFKTFYSLIWTFIWSQSTSRDIDHKCCSWKQKTGTQMHLEGQRFRENLTFLTFLVLLSNQIHLKSVLLILRYSPFFLIQSGQQKCMLASQTPINRSYRSSELRQIFLAG